MHSQSYKSIILAGVALALVNCGPQKKEESQPEQTPMMELQKPEVPTQNETPLTPEQEDQLKIDEDNVMTPLPG